MHREVVLTKTAKTDPLNLYSYRGISFLENTYKLYSTNRMKKAKEYIQGAKQHGFTAGAGHSISEATRPMI